MKIALIYTYLTQQVGTKGVFELLCKHYLNIYIFSFIPEAKCNIKLRNYLVHIKALQHYSLGAAEHFSVLANLQSPAFRAINLRNYNLLIKGRDCLKPKSIVAA